MTRGLTGLLVMAALGVSGCSDPYASAPPEPQPVSSAAEAPVARPEVGDAQPPAAPAPRAAEAADARTGRSPGALARAFATRSINWDWRRLADDLATLRRLSTEPLTAELDRTAASVALDESLKRDRPGGRGRVLAVAISGHGSSRRVVVVTREQALERGRVTLEGKRARVYTGETRLTETGWRMRGWEREP